jgi:Zn-dependent protease
MRSGLGPSTPPSPATSYLEPPLATELLPSGPWPAAAEESRDGRALPPAHPRYGLAVVLFLLTLFTTTTLGPIFYMAVRADVTAPFEQLLTPGLVAWVWSNPDVLRLGLAFALPAMFILLVHELGHYLMCRRYGLPCTPPYFLPLPITLGTLGAFIRIRAPIRSKRELFDIGIAGPLAGVAALLPFLLIGIARSEPVPLRLAAGSILSVPGHSLAIELATRLFHGRLPDDMMLNLHPFALAAWFGLLATALNLIPIGQLDGGHILYAVVGPLQRRLALPLWAAFAAAGYFWLGWIVWAVVAVVLGIYHPPVVDEATPLDRRRRWLAVAALVVLLLSFTPRGLYELRVGGAPPPHPPARGSSWAQLAGGEIKNPPPASPARR